MKAFIIVIVAVIILLIPTCSLVIPTFGDYSDGVRSGTLQKFSKKGIIFKTFEGQLAMDGLVINKDGEGSSSMFEFSVISQGIALKLDSCVGKKVTLKYVQKMHVNSKEAETDYIITDVTLNK